MENNNLNVPESIWADGCPENIDEKDIIQQEELHAMAVDYVVKNVLIPKGFKLEQGFPRRQFPNIVCKRDGELYCIVVFPSVFPNLVTMVDEFRLQIVEMAKKNNATPLYGTVGYMSIDEERAKAGLTLKGDVFKTSFPGFHVLTDEPTQNYQVPVTELFRP